VACPVSAGGAESKSSEQEESSRLQATDVIIASQNAGLLSMISISESNIAFARLSRSASFGALTKNFISPQVRVFQVCRCDNSVGKSINIGDLSYQSTIACAHTLLDVQTVIAQIVLRILPDLGNRYALMAHGEKIGEVDTLTDAVLVRDCIKNQDLTISQARAMLQADADSEGESSSMERFDP
jgi:hypothetical protein